MPCKRMTDESNVPYSKMTRTAQIEKRRNIPASVNCKCELTTQFWRASAQKILLFTVVKFGIYPISQFVNSLPGKERRIISRVYK